MLHGVVRGPRTTTYYGDDAQRMMARMSAQYCFSQADADEKVEKAGSPYIRKFLVEELTKRSFKFDEKKIAELDARDEKKEAEQKAAHVKKVKAEYRALPVETKTTSSKCSFCKQRIAKGQSYHDGDKGRRAHVDCVKA
jgi:flagellar motor protein MotB